METRSSRYLDENISTRPKSTRTSKNRYLYDDVNNKIGYEEIDSLSSYGGVELDRETPIRSRDEYQKMIKPIVEEKPASRENHVKEEKVYDINSVLEEAKKNRVLPYDEEKKRNFQSVEYSILADLNKKYMTKKEKIEEDLEKEGIRELIDTITSKNLSSDLAGIDEEDDGKDLMSDLMATNAGLEAISDISLEEEIAKEILAEKEERAEKEAQELTKEESELVNSFYTKSMDLSEHDFELRNEIVEENKEKRKILILVVLIILVVIAIASILILKKINII